MLKDPAKRIAVEATTTISEDLVSFLESISWGTGDTAYKADAIKEKLLQIPHPLYFIVRMDGAIIGAVVFSERILRGAQRQMKALYIRYLSVSPGIMGKAVIKSFGSLVFSYLKEKEEAGFVLYTCIEMQNNISQNIVTKLGFKNTAKAGVIGFSRFFPRTTSKVRLLTSAEEKENISFLLETFYKDHNLLQFDSLNLLNAASNYYGYYENGRMVAGAQVSKGNWKIDNLGTANLSFLVKLLPRIPLVNKYFNPGDFRFITFDGIYVEAGKRKYLLKLFEHLLRVYGVRAAVFWADIESALYGSITIDGGLGFLHAIVKSSGSFIYAKFPVDGSSPELPVYVSSKELV